MSIDNCPACRVLLVYPAAKFDTTYLHWGLTSYNRKIDNARSAIYSPKLTSRRFRLNYEVYLYPFLWYMYTHSLTRILVLQLKIHNIWMGFFWNQKIFHLNIYNRNFNPIVKFTLLFLIKLSVSISDSSKIFPNFSAGSSFLGVFLNKFWNVRLSDKCYSVLLKVSCLEKIQYSYFIPHTNKCFG